MREKRRLRFVSVEELLDVLGRLLTRAREAEPWRRRWLERWDADEELAYALARRTGRGEAVPLAVAVAWLSGVLGGNYMVSTGPILVAVDGDGRLYAAVETPHGELVASQLPAELLQELAVLDMLGAWRSPGPKRGAEAAVAEKKRLTRTIAVVIPLTRRAARIIPREKPATPEVLQQLISARMRRGVDYTIKRVEKNEEFVETTRKHLAETRLPAVLMRAITSSVEAAEGERIAA